MPKTICFLAYDGVELLDLAGPQSAFNEAIQVHKNSYQLQVIGFCDTAINCEAGLTITPSVSIEDVKNCHTLIIPGGKGARSTSIDSKQLSRLKVLMSKCERVVSICTGVYLTARAGLPNNTNVATHWAFVSDLKKRYPKLNVDSEKLFVRDGRYWSSAGVTSGIDLALRLIEIDEGKNLAHHVAKHLVVYLKRTGGQKQFSDIMDVQTPKTDRLESLFNWIKEHIEEELTVNRLADVIHLSERQCHRFFVKETGFTPAQYVEKYRMQLASELLLSSQKEIKIIAKTVGFSSPDGFRRAFERNFSISPLAYRKAFQSKTEEVNNV
ncbi:GlxA family transcriptional regulator [Psychrobium sp. 1_MG-2023]|uniref:GlxA family transcriptional regulator n=1 Tax=Psychrobium sp. 1_MG-2023 TaxID=3062624 RepID=UPI000C33194C|nr:DJ-1/PfpI family protein [Psychrobium sp. 1_MG-2023]MDP2562279.1 DJ-1/PfpI family protein [Psychrobium sp. 1_MG-2023]PKF54662.1 AraC family transcriptional regulator [Alteromonadales bacterium alter-6D02]